jgi:hypothetical protein
MNNWTIYGGYEVYGLIYFDTALKGEKWLNRCLPQ